MDTQVPKPLKFKLDEIPSRHSQFYFLTHKEQQTINKEMEISVKAGEFVGLIYDALLKQYINPENENSLKSLNMLCVRLVFCLYAEDAHRKNDIAVMNAYGMPIKETTPESCVANLMKLYREKTGE